MADATIPISEPILARLRELARWASISLDEALDQAVKDQYDRKFWEATNAGYAALRADSQGGAGEGGQGADGGPGKALEGTDGQTL